MVLGFFLAIFHFASNRHVCLCMIKLQLCRMKNWHTLMNEKYKYEKIRNPIEYKAVSCNRLHILVHEHEKQKRCYTKAIYFSFNQNLLEKQETQYRCNREEKSA